MQVWIEKTGDSSTIVETITIDTTDYSSNFGDLSKMVEEEPLSSREKMKQFWRQKQQNSWKRKRLRDEQEW